MKKINLEYLSRDYFKGSVVLDDVSTLSFNFCLRIEALFEDEVEFNQGSKQSNTNNYHDFAWHYYYSTKYLTIYLPRTGPCVKMLFFGVRLTERQNTTRHMKIYRDYLNKLNTENGLSAAQYIQHKKEIYKSEDGKVIIHYPGGLYKPFFGGKGFAPIWKEYQKINIEKADSKKIKKFIDKHLIYKPEGFTLYLEKKDLEVYYIQQKLAA